eukprot:TRINITY_DN15831_c0_g1_i1.p1 TRINITY_DN15831_c0_g1~~TRINITY_DN15831_c0_g1_i1.p1  ORF type:complete len:840 (+),score=243.47 TRINITY_DN15831_c0_g1_i1:165-2684(+)
MSVITPVELEDLADAKVKVFKDFLAAEPPTHNGDKLLALWRELYDDDVKKTVVQTVTGPSDDETNPVFPYEKLQAIVGDGNNWKWPRMWQRLDEMERRGAAYREGEKLNFNQPNKNPNVKSQRVLVVGGGPCGMRMAIEMVMGGHKVTVFEKRREIRNDDGSLKQLGFTNRINRPHMWPFVRNDLARLNGKDFMSRQACYPVFTEPETSSIGIDELQVLLLKNALLLGVDFRLGIGYDDAKIVTDPTTMKPTWKVECSVDAQASQQFGMPQGKNEVVFDVIIGCDGPRSTVRDTQSKWFGNIEKRKFMDCVGIVANVRKVSRKRLKELGFEYGQEPSDMNRTKMVFRPFFDKINEEAQADLENLIYYKASFHNYCILTPKRQNLVQHGLSGRVYHFAAAREGADKNAEEKAKLKKYCKAVLKAAGIPVDENEPNEGFVDAPNDVMAFDFAECWNTKQSIVFNLPPPDYDTTKHGPWMGKRLVPFVGLCGDALLEPFWPMGLGLKRGWQAIMDTAYAVDNLYNRTCFAESLGKSPEQCSWNDHFEALAEQVNVNFENCNRLKVAEELGKGEYSEKGLVMTQLKKLFKDAEKPMFEVEIDPWTRYQPLEYDRNKKYDAMARADPEWLHPKVRKEVAKREFYQEQAKAGGAKGEIEYHGKDLISVNGRPVAQAGGGGYQYQPPRRQSSIAIQNQNSGGGVRPAINAEEVSRKSSIKKENLVASITAAQMDEHVMKKKSNEAASASSLAMEAVAARSRMNTAASSTLDDPVTRDEIAHITPVCASEHGVAASTEAMWDRMHSKNLSPSQEAELAHVRHMIDALGKSIESYKQAEKTLLMSVKK